MCRGLVRGFEIPRSPFKKSVGTNGTWGVSFLTRRRSMKKSPVAVILLAVLFLALPAPSPACGIAMTLWDLVQSADLVAVARVVRVDSDPTPFEPFPDGDDSHDVVVLDLLETWKGT